MIRREILRNSQKFLSEWIIWDVQMYSHPFQRTKTPVYISMAIYTIEIAKKKEKRKGKKETNGVEVDAYCLHNL